MSAGFNLKKLLHKPERLTCLIEACGSVCRNTAAVLGDLQKFLFSYRIGTFCCHFGSKLCITLCILNNCLTGKDNCVKEMRFLNIVAVSNLASVEFRLSFVDNSLITDCKNFFIFNSYMSDTIVEIVSWCKNIMINCSDCFRCHVGSRKLTGGLAFPVFMYLSQLLLGFLSNVKWVRGPCCNRIQFILQPLIGKFRESLAASRCNRTASDNQLIITNNNRDVTKNMCKSFRTSGDRRLSLCGLIGFRDQLRSGRFNNRHVCIQCRNQLRDPG